MWIDWIGNESKKWIFLMMLNCEKLYWIFFFKNVIKKYFLPKNFFKKYINFNTQRSSLADKINKYFIQNSLFPKSVNQNWIFSLTLATIKKSFHAKKLIFKWKFNESLHPFKFPVFWLMKKNIFVPTGNYETHFSYLNYKNNICVNKIFM